MEGESHCPGTELKVETEKSGRSMDRDESKASPDHIPFFPNTDSRNTLGLGFLYFSSLLISL